MKEVITKEGEERMKEREEWWILFTFILTFYARFYNVPSTYTYKT